MAMAWIGDGVGHAEKDVLVRDPVVVTASLPHFLAPGDRSRLALDLASVADVAGHDRRCRSPPTGDGRHRSIRPSPSRSVELAAGERKQILVPVSGERVGDDIAHRVDDASRRRGAGRRT